jgi:NAD(P)-dependent dehydrogenase (short-subunit alcohol dehydrogenase family)
MILKNKKVLVVGAAGLIGREIVKSIIDEGGKVIGADISREALIFMSEELPKESFIATDLNITDKNQVNDAIRYCVANFGGIDGAVNAAYPRNKNYGNTLFNVTYEDFSENIALHLGGYFIFMQQCAAYAKTNNIPFSHINLSSIYGVMAPRFDLYNDTKMTMPVEYAAIKSALVHLNKYFTSYMKGTNFRVNSISPGGLLDNQDNQFVLKYNSYCSSKGMLNSTDITGTVNFLLSDMSKYLKGQDIVVDDGFSQ